MELFRSLLYTLCIALFFVTSVSVQNGEGSFVRGVTTKSTPWPKLLLFEMFAKPFANIRRTRSISRSGLGPPDLRHSIASQQELRGLFDLSRKSRSFTAHGTLGPSSSEAADAVGLRSGTHVGEFESDDLQFISFLESWAALRSFDMRSSLHGVGSTILRAIERYPEMSLDQSTAWTFLQEIGAIPAWETSGSYELRIPGIGRRLQSEPSRPKEVDVRDDVMKDLRHDWGKLPVYCIDQESALEIDDGISIEATKVSTEYWIHIHTADPASIIAPNSELAKFAELRTQTIYMPENTIPMLPPSLTQASLSLAPDRPCLTFSARMSLDGKILEYKISPGTVRNVIFLSPAVMKEVIKGPVGTQDTKTARLVGSEIPSSSPGRPMARSQDLDDTHRSNLRMIQAIGKHRNQILKSRGGVFTSLPQAMISVSFNGIPWKGVPMSRACHYHDDPSIQLITASPTPDTGSGLPRPTEDDTVRDIMLIASEVAARWCHERNIPVPFRVTPRNPEKPNHSDFFREKVLPSMDANGNIPENILIQYFQTMGPVSLSSTAGPHAALGVDMALKATSPLRRYGDLLLHWQVEAALLEEDRSSKSLVGNTEHNYLPFSKLEVEARLPRLATRERLGKYAQRRADRQWLCLFLLRAWKFGQAVIPPTFHCVVRSSKPTVRKIEVFLPDFATSATIIDSPLRLDINQIQPGEGLEVELEDINVYDGTIIVKPLMYSDSAKSM